MAGQRLKFHHKDTGEDFEFDWSKPEPPTPAELREIYKQQHPEPKGMLSSAWDFVTKPISDAWEGYNKPIVSILDQPLKGIPHSPTMRQISKENYEADPTLVNRAIKFGGETAADALSWTSSPAALTMGAVGAGTGAAAAAGRTGLARAGKLALGGMSTAYTGAGGKHMYEAKTPEEFIGGAMEAGGGLLGLYHGATSWKTPPPEVPTPQGGIDYFEPKVEAYKQAYTHGPELEGPRDMTGFTELPQRQERPAWTEPETGGETPAYMSGRYGISQRDWAANDPTLATVPNRMRPPAPTERYFDQMLPAAMREQMGPVETPPSMRGGPQIGPVIPPPEMGGPQPPPRPKPQPRPRPQPAPPLQEPPVERPPMSAGVPKVPNPLPNETAPQYAARTGFTPEQSQRVVESAARVTRSNEALQTQIQATRAGTMGDIEPLNLHVMTEPGPTPTGQMPEPTPDRMAMGEPRFRGPRQEPQTMPKKAPPVLENPPLGEDSGFNPDKPYARVDESSVRAMAEAGDLDAIRELHERGILGTSDTAPARPSRLGKLLKNEAGSAGEQPPSKTVEERAKELRFGAREAEPIRPGEQKGVAQFEDPNAKPLKFTDEQGRPVDKTGRPLPTELPLTTDEMEQLRQIARDHGMDPTAIDEVLRPSIPPEPTGGKRGFPEFEPRPQNLEQPGLPMPMKLRDVKPAIPVPEPPDVKPVGGPKQGRLKLRSEEFWKRRPTISSESVKSASESLKESRESADIDHDYAKRELGKIAKGKPGLSVDDTGFAGGGKVITYYGPDGTPIAHAEIIPDLEGNQKVPILVGDKSKGMLYGRAVAAVLKKLDELGASETSGSYSKHTKNLIKGLDEFIRDERGAMPVPEWANKAAGKIKEGVGKAAGQVKEDYQKYGGPGAAAVNVGRGMKQVGKAVTAIGRESRTLQTAVGDISAPRQAALMIGRKEFWNNVPKLFKAYASPEYAKQRRIDLALRDSYPRMKEAGLFLSDIGTEGGQKPKGFEEQYQGTTVKRIPGLKQLIRASENSFTTFINDVRADAFENFTKMMDDAGETSPDVKERNPETGKMETKKLGTDKQMAKLVGNLTGRGDLGPLEPAAKQLAGLLFSPRLLASRIQTMNYLNPMTFEDVHPKVRAEAVKSMKHLMGAGAAFLGLLKAGGALTGTDVDVELDSRSSDFLKGRIGHTRFDWMEGMQQPIRLAAQVISGEQKSPITGKVSTLGSSPVVDTRADKVYKFGESKLAPIWGVGAKWARGKDIEGRPFSPKKEALGMITPLSGSDIWEVAKDNPDALKGDLSSIAKIAGTGAWSTFGGGTQTFKQSVKRSGKRRSRSSRSGSYTAR